MVEKNDIAASIEQDNMKPFILHGVDNLPGFVSKKKHTEKNEAYYTKIILNALQDVEDELIYGDDELERDLEELKTKLISGKMVLVEDTDMQPGDDIGYDEQDGIAGNLCSIRKKEETVAVEKEEELTSETRRQKLEKETKLILKAVDGYRMLLFTMPSTGAYDANLVAELGSLREDLSDGDIFLSKNSETHRQTLEKETKLIKELLHSYELTSSTTLDMYSNEVRELSKKLFNGDIILVENEEKVICEEISAGEEEGEGNEAKSPYAAFWRRLRHLKSRRKRKSMVKVLTETTIEEFQTQLTKYTNGGFTIKYVNIDTKAGNSGSGVRYYAVVQHR